FVGIKTMPALAYANWSAVDDFKLVYGSFSVLFPVCLNFSLAAGSQDPETQAAGDDDPMFWWAKLGWQTKMFPDLGKTSFSVDYGEADDFGSQGDEFESVGVAVVQKLDDWGTEVFVSGRNYSLKQPTQDYQDIFVFVSGARIKF
ncbi:MAG: hypothetical protein J4G10_07525, partial [Alphaproteobacteria bacterium]|nr:hypothetical protein [Alphaproteobacteria bacterium]